MGGFVWLELIVVMVNIVFGKFIYELVLFFRKDNSYGSGYW